MKNVEGSNRRSKVRKELINKEEEVIILVMSRYRMGQNINAITV